MSTAPILDRRQIHHLLRETLVSMLVNATLSALFVFLIFGGRDHISLWGARGLALDFVPQTLIIAFMSTLVPSAITRRSVRIGRIAGVGTSVSNLPRNLLLRGLIIALLVSLVAVPLAIAAVALGAGRELPFATVLPMKVAYGAALALLVTSFAIRAALGDGGEA